MASKLMIAAALVLPVALAAPQSGLTNTRSSNIIGGEDASPGDFPYIVAITYEDAEGVVSCGGSLANENTVITAAHCSTGEVAKYSVRAGSLNWTTGGQEVSVESMIVHPEYNNETYAYDVAIWKLAPQIQVVDGISFAKLPEAGSDPPANSTVTAAGWGYINLLGFAVEDLQKVSISVVDREVCNEDYATDDMEITDTMFCAGSPTGHHDHCYGDSGGPVIDQDGVLVGIISWAKLCALPRYPGVSSRVAALLDFIEENL